MANEQNLIPNEKRTPSERRENARKAGIASGEARRKKKTMKQAMNLLLSLPVSDENMTILEQLGIDSDDADNQMLVMVSMMQRAIKGNVSAAQFIVSVTGSTAMTETERAKINLEKKRFKLEEKQFAQEQNTGNDEIQSKQDAITEIVEQLRPISDDEVMDNE